MAETLGNEIEFYRWSDLGESLKQKILNYLPFSTLRRFMFLSKDCYSLVSTMKYTCYALTILDYQCAVGSERKCKEPVVEITVSWAESVEAAEAEDYRTFSIEFVRDRDGFCFVRKREETLVIGARYEDGHYEAALRVFFKLTRMLIPEIISVHFISLKPGITRVLKEQPKTTNLHCGTLEVQTNDPAVFAGFVKFLTPGCCPKVYGVYTGKHHKRTFLQRSFFDTDVARRAPVLQLYVRSDVTDDQLIQLQAVEIDLRAPRVSSAGLNRLLLQWHEGKRKIVGLSIEEVQNPDKTEILRGLDPARILTGEALLPFLPDECTDTVGIYSTAEELFLLTIDPDRIEFWPN